MAITLQNILALTAGILGIGLVCLFIGYIFGKHAARLIVVNGQSGRLILDKKPEPFFASDKANGGAGELEEEIDPFQAAAYGLTEGKHGEMLGVDAKIIPYRAKE